MRNGKKHDLVDLPEIIREEHEANGMRWTNCFKYVCSACGERYQKRSPAPSCAIDNILKIERVAREHDCNEPMLDRYLLKLFHWPKYERERFIAAWKVWREFAT